MHKPNNNEKPSLIMCGSRNLTDKQANYGTLELEALAILHACQKCDFYLRDLQMFEVQTHYSPLQRQMRSINNARLLQIREKLATYNFHVTRAPGKENKIADALSRAPIFKAEDKALTTSTSIQCLATTTMLETLV